MLYADENRIICDCLFVKNPGIPKRAGLIFDYNRNFWYTNSGAVARRLGPYLTSRDLEVIDLFESEQIRRRTPGSDHSKQTQHPLFSLVQKVCKDTDRKSPQNSSSTCRGYSR